MTAANARTDPRKNDHMPAYDPRLIDGPFLDPPFEARRPARLLAPIVFNSPHSGRRYPPSLLARSKLDALAIRRSEDSYVDELFQGVVEIGLPLLCAHFPRAYVDVNREPYELDPAMFAGPLPAHANTRSRRVHGGLGTIARIVGDGTEIYEQKLDVEEAEWRIATLYEPYHAALRGLMDEAARHFGCAVLVDCHSMPSAPGANDLDHGSVRPDIVLGDRFGTSASPALVDTAEAVLRRLGFSVTRNRPYAGGFITEHYGRPRSGVHALQIEINRALYMDEITVERRPGFARVAAAMTAFARTLMALDRRRLAL